MAGCISSAPVNNTDFGRIEKIEQLEGVYKNSGEAPTPFFLSRIIWPNEKELIHALIDTVEVRKVGSKTLMIRAIGEGVVKIESTFIKGIDFEIEDGRIRLNQHIGVFGFQKGDPFLGPYYESSVLGLDTTGQGKFRHRIGMIGLLVIFPIAMGGDEEIRFVKIKD